MTEQLLTLPAKLFLGKGVDKKFPFLVNLYKKAVSVVAKDSQVVVSLPLNSKLLVSTKDAGLGMMLRTHGMFEPLQTKLFLKSVKPGDTVLDVGANVGYYTVLASKTVGPKGRVFAFEPDPRNLTLLRKNAVLNKCRNVVIVNKAVDSTKGRSSFLQDHANPGESRLVNNKGTIRVSTTSLDAFVKNAHVRRVDVVKMDIEGAEVAAIVGAKKTFSPRKGTTLFIECNPGKLAQSLHAAEDLLRAMQTVGFRPQLIINEVEHAIVPFTKKTLAKMLKRRAFVTIVARK